MNIKGQHEGAKRYRYQLGYKFVAANVLGPLTVPVCYHPSRLIDVEISNA
jgi:hypothetical protein